MVNRQVMMEHAITAARKVIENPFYLGRLKRFFWLNH
jgi:hypothetical protein